MTATAVPEAPPSRPTKDREPLAFATVAKWFGWVVTAAVVILLIIGAFTSDPIRKMWYSIVIGVGAAAALFIGYNKILDQSRARWPLIPAGLGAMVGLVVGAALQHNGWFPPDALGILLGGLVGFVVGYGLGMALTPDLAGRVRWEQRLRPIGFVGPAVMFVLVFLIIPSFRTIVLSFKGGRRGEGSLTLDQYRNVLGDDTFFSVDGFTNIFTSRLFIVGVFALVFAVVAAWASTQKFLGTDQARNATNIMRVLGGAVVVMVALAIIGFFEAVFREPNESDIVDVLTKVVSSTASLIVVLVAAALVLALFILGRSRGSTADLDWGTPSSSLVAILGVILLLFAVLSTMQAVIWNNLWWVVTVAGLSTVLGLLLAILADRSSSEKWAKTMIFMPMAISMVGAAVIWDFMYTRSPGDDQLGLLNAIIQGLGFSPAGFFNDGLQAPWNNIWIMIIMIWIQAGFAMVVLSAAIKSVPDDLLEAARVDGATEIQVFWRIVIPQIRPTILVVLTTLIIIVMKVYDLVKATTNGRAGTEVFANAMFNELRNPNFPKSAVFAVTIFVLTLPVMVYNIRRTQKEVA
ncbi:MAG: sugar ABC transporter permease [Acidimicrobiales bacterium]